MVEREERFWIVRFAIQRVTSFMIHGVTGYEYTVHSLKNSFTELQFHASHLWHQNVNTFLLVFFKRFYFLSYLKYIYYHFRPDFQKPLKSFKWLVVIPLVAFLIEFSQSYEYFFNIIIY